MSSKFGFPKEDEYITRNLMTLGSRPENF
jgi:hypothetical protein